MSRSSGGPRVNKRRPVVSQKKAMILAPGESRTGAPLRIYSDQLKVKLSGADTAGACAIVESVTEPQSGPPLHRHTREDEHFYVLEGQFLFEIDGRRIPAGPGASLYAPRGTAHTFQNVGAAPGRLLVVSQPAGLDSFFIDMDAAAAGNAQPDLATLLPIFEKYGLELLGRRWPR
jgi:mannose-6-phosphate isomerase-like protein (cupin superfamily)